MRRAKRILLIGGVLLVSVGTADARLWGSRKAEKPAVKTAVPGAVVLSAVEVDGSRVVLRTSGAPAYTSYSPSPGVFVIDLTGTSRDAAAVVPSTLPAAVASISADEVVEMGTRLTRVTFRFADSIIPEIAAAENSVVVTVPATAIPIENVASNVDVMPAVVPLASPVESQPEAAIVEVPAQVVEVPAEAPVVEEPIAVVEDVVLPRARAVKRIGATTSNGEVEVRISADGELKYKAFRLDNPARLVIDLDGVKNAAAKNNVAIDDDVVKGVRVAQFQPTVARVVVDLAHRTEWQIQPAGDSLRITFPATPTSHVVATPAPVKPEPVSVKIAEVEPEPAPPAQVRKPIVIQEVPASVPTIAENASTWKMPDPQPSQAALNPTQAALNPTQASRGARKVINAPEDQEPPVRPDDVFATPQQTATQPQTLSGSRTLSGGPRVFNGEPLSLNLKDADIKDVVRTFAELTGLNIAVDPGVSGSVTVDFVDVPWDQALDLILRQNNLTYVLEGNVMRIGYLARLADEVQAARLLAEAERLNVPLTTLSFKLSYARATDVASLLRGIASIRAQIIVDARTNQLVVSEVPVYLQTMQNLIATIDIPTRQVMIEARIVESARTFAQEWGVDWDFGGTLDPALGTGTGLVFPNRVGFRGGPFNFGGAAAPVLTLNFLDVLGVFDLDVTLRAAENAGYIKVISAPRVTTQDNTPAEIQSGFQIPYQTRINFTTTVTYLDATLRLSVVPQITEAGTVIMDIAVQKNEPAEGLAFEGAAGTPLTTRQARTRLMVRDGGTAVIAGIFTTRDTRSQRRVPIVHNIPIIGELFKTHNTNTSHDELLIFITPRIVRG